MKEMNQVVWRRPWTWLQSQQRQHRESEWLMTLISSK